MDREEAGRKEAGKAGNKQERLEGSKAVKEQERLEGRKEERRKG